MADHQITASRGDGFTLVELLIVVAMMGVLMTTLAGVLVVVLRTTPPTEARTDDARSLQGLVTWLPQDIDAAPPDGFNIDPGFWPCGGAVPADSSNVLALGWTEATQIDVDYAATYRYELDGSNWSMARYTCTDGGTGVMGAAERINLTGGLPPWDISDPPATVTMCSVTVDVGGNCPLGSEVIDPSVDPVKSLKFSITMSDGSVSTIDAAPKNPDQLLSDDPNASTNSAPTVVNFNHNLQIYAGDTVVVDLKTTHKPSDPDPADDGLLSVAIDSSEPAPANVTASTSDPLIVTLTADPAAPAGVIADPLVLIISDDGGAWTDATITVEILSTPNQPPTVDHTNEDVTLNQGSSIVLSLDASHGATDPDDDTLSVAIDDASPMPADITTTISGLDVTLTADPAAPAGGIADPLVLIISDGQGGTVPVTITITITTTTTNAAPTFVTSNFYLEIFAGDSLTFALNESHGVYDPDEDTLSFAVDDTLPMPADITTTVGTLLNVTIDANPTATIGPRLSPVTLIVSDIHGATATVTITVGILPTPPPPSNCVLGSLKVQPNPVDRQGAGTGSRHLKDDVTVELSYTGLCDGLTLTYDTGDTSGLGFGTGRVFPPGSPSSISIVSNGNGGTEKWTPGAHTLTASTTSAVTPASTTVDLIVT